MLIDLSLTGIGKSEQISALSYKLCPRVPFLSLNPVSDGSPVSTLLQILRHPTLPLCLSTRFRTAHSALHLYPPPNPPPSYLVPLSLNPLSNSPPRLYPPQNPPPSYLVPLLFQPLSHGLCAPLSGVPHQPVDLRRVLVLLQEAVDERHQGACDTHKARVNRTPLGRGRPGDEVVLAGRMVIG